MRRGDCCLLSWADVDLHDGFITVKTSKTGETVDIPMFGLMRDMLTDAYARAKAALPAAKRGRKPKPEGFVFPDQAAMYLNSPDGITWRVKRVIAEAFKMKAAAAGDVLPAGDADEVRRRRRIGLGSGSWRRGFEGVDSGGVKLTEEWRDVTDNRHQVRSRMHCGLSLHPTRSS